VAAAEGEHVISAIAYELQYAFIKPALSISGQAPAATSDEKAI
jgi:hypothetical protein